MIGLSPSLGFRLDIDAIVESDKVSQRRALEALARVLDEIHQLLYSSITADHNALGVHQITIPTYANNAAAIAGGLQPGQLYRVNAVIDPEPLYVVH